MKRLIRDWKGKVAVITGASSGIGEATARKLAGKGLKVALVARREERLQKIVSEIEGSGGQALAVPADLADESGRQQTVEAILCVYGSPDVLVNNAGFGWYGFSEDMPWAVANQMIQVNAAAGVELSLRLLGEMRARNSGHIINVSSVAGSLPSQGVALYCATKSFLDTFTTALYRELRGSNVHVSVVRPGPVTTEFFAAAASKPAGYPVPAEAFAIGVSAIADRIWSVLNRPRRVIYVPRLLSLAPWIELSFGWLIDRFGPFLLRNKLAHAWAADRNR
jgi:short-subunit dehydrogenase